MRLVVIPKTVHADRIAQNIDVFDFQYYKSNESSASIHICIVPSRYNLAYSSGSSMAR